MLEPQTTTFMILGGDICTRAAALCHQTGHPFAPDAENPGGSRKRLADEIEVCRNFCNADDLPDGGAALLRPSAIREQNPDAVQLSSLFPISTHGLTS